MVNIGNWLAYLFLLILGGAAAYVLAKGNLQQDIERENKWAAYEHRTRKDKR
ncbi:MAG: hypothetical protein IJI14_14130 [Anaerolineaceae bacterium]|nr:hypothetical protein [Anaerolineaceae bacterium]